MSVRRTYRVKLEFLCQVDDEPLTEVKRLMQEQANLLYHTMAKDDIRFSLQTDFGVTDTGASELHEPWPKLPEGTPRCLRAVGGCKRPAGHEGVYCLSCRGMRGLSRAHDTSKSRRTCSPSGKS